MSSSSCCSVLARFSPSWTSTASVTPLVGVDPQADCVVDRLCCPGDDGEDGHGLILLSAFWGTAEARLVYTHGGAPFYGVEPTNPSELRGPDPVPAGTGPSLVVNQSVRGLRHPYRDSATLKMRVVSRGFGVVEQSILEELVRDAASDGAWGASVVPTWHPRAALSRSSINRAIWSLERKLWVSPERIRAHTTYFRPPPGVDAKGYRFEDLADDLFDERTGKRVFFDCVRSMTAVAFSIDPHPWIDSRMTPLFEDKFWELFEIRAACSDAVAEDVKQSETRLVTRSV